MSENKVTFGELLKRIAALEETLQDLKCERLKGQSILAVARERDQLQEQLAESDRRLDNHQNRLMALEAIAVRLPSLSELNRRAIEPPARDQQAERIDALERELGSVRESYRQSVENHKACLEQLRVAVERADANQSAADTLERLRKGESLPIADELVWLTTRNDHAARLERDALAAKVATLEKMSEFDTKEKVDLERRLAERDRDAERWKWVERKVDVKLSHYGNWYWCVHIAKSALGSFASHIDAAIAAERHPAPPKEATT